MLHKVATQPLCAQIKARRTIGTLKLLAKEKTLREQSSSTIQRQFVLETEITGSSVVSVDDAVNPRKVHIHYHGTLPAKFRSVSALSKSRKAHSTIGDADYIFGIYMKLCVMYTYRYAHRLLCVNVRGTCLQATSTASHGTNAAVVFGANLVYHMTIQYVNNVFPGWRAL